MGRNLALFLIKVCGVALLFVLKNLPWVKEMSIYDHWLLSTINTISFLLVISIMLQIFLQAYRRRRKIGQQKVDNFISGFGNLFNVLTIVCFLYLGLKVIGIGIGEFFTTISIVAAALVLLTKEYLSGLISGFIISFSNVINIGDTIKLGEKKGKVQDITLSKTTILTEDEELILIPNDKVFFSEIINYSKGNRRRVSINFEMDIKTLGTVDQLERDLIEELEEFAEYLEPGSYSLRVEDIYKDYIDFKFLYTINKIDPRIEGAIKRKTIREVVDYIKRKTV